MKVAHELDHITHAVIGGQASMNFGISDDPAFFQILSSALYKNPTLAMVRETICNAWDSHIENGITDKPLRITLDDEYLIIQDFGGGIPQNLIQPVYGIYGASTKKNDGRQTGGFGLGCKSPFAYTDHFEVTSSHQGIKTIYNMSKSSAEVGGKPAIVPIASFPTTESGITVKIPLDPMKTNYRIESYIKTVVFNGDILADLNGQIQPVLGLDSSEQGLIIILNEAGDSYEHLLDEDRERGCIFIRYGNVVYPVEHNEGYAELYIRTTKVLRNRYNGNLVIQAPADSISMTPSRESLTFSDITVSTINSLLAKFLAVTAKSRVLVTEHRQEIEGYIDAAVAMELEKPALGKLPLGAWAIPGVPNTLDQPTLSTTDDFNKMEAILRFSGKKGISRRDWFKHIQAFLYKVNQSGYYDRGQMQKWLRTTQKNLKVLTSPERNGSYWHTPKEKSLATLWWRKNVLAPLVLSLQDRTPLFNRKSLYYTSFHSEKLGSYNKPILQRASRVKIEDHTQNVIHLLKPVVILCHNADVLSRRLENTRLVEASSGMLSIKTYFVYEVSRKKDELSDMQKALSSMDNIEFLDLTGRTPYEQASYEERQVVIAQERADRAAGRPVKTALVKKPKKGLYRLDGLLDTANQRINTLRFSRDTDPVCIKKPKAVLSVSIAKDNLHEFSGLGSKVSFAIAALYGEHIGISNKTTSIVKMVEEGESMEASDFVLDSIMHDMQNDPEMLAYQEVSSTKIENYIDKISGWETCDTIKALMRLVSEYPELKPASLPSLELSKKGAYRQTIWENARHISYRRREETAPIVEKIESIPLNQAVKDFIDKLNTNTLLEALDFSKVKKNLRNKNLDPIERDKIVQLIKLVIS